MMSIWAIKRAHPLYSWWDSVLEWHRLRQESLEPMPWNQIGYGAIVVCLCLVLLSQFIHRFDQDNWVCTRPGYAPIWIKGQLVAAAPCSEETHVRTGEVRVTAFGKSKEQS